MSKNVTKARVVMMPVADIVPYDRNPRRNDDAVKYVANSIREFGFKQPIVVDKDNIIIAGHTRWKASKKLGLTEVPVIVADDLTEEQVKAYRIADNSSGEVAEWDYDVLDDILQDIPYDMSNFGLNLDDIMKSESDTGEIVEDDIPDVDDAEPRVKRGQVWKLGNHRLMCGDSTSEGDVKRLMGEREG